MSKKDWRQMPAQDVLDGTYVNIFQYKSGSQRMYAYSMEMISVIMDKNSRSENSAFIVPVGPTQQYPILADLINACDVSLKNTYFYNMDEYTLDDGAFIPKGDPLSFRGIMDDLFYNRVKPELVMAEDHRWFPTLGREDEMWQHMQGVGGIDICFGGIGINGHVAFNEALYGDDARSRCRFPRRPACAATSHPRAQGWGTSGGLQP